MIRGIKEAQRHHMTQFYPKTCQMQGVSEIPSCPTAKIPELIVSLLILLMFRGDLLAASQSVRIVPNRIEGFISTPATVEAQVEGEPGLYFEWYLDNDLVASGPESQITLADPFRSSIRLLTVVASSVNTVVTSPPVRLVGYPIPSPVVGQLPPQIQNRGEDIRLFQRSAGATFQWFFGGEPIPGQTNSTLRLQRAQPTVNGSYTVQSRYSFTNVMSDPVVVRVPPTPPNADTTEGGFLRPAGTSVSLTINTSETDSFVTYWFKDGEPLAATQGPTLTLSNLTSLNSGFYKPILSNAWGIAAGGRICLRVLPQRQPGYVAVFGKPSFGASLTPPDLTNVVQVSAGPDSAAALGLDGTVWGWGLQSPNRSLRFEFPGKVAQVEAGNGSLRTIEEDGRGRTFFGQSREPNVSSSRWSDSDGFNKSSAQLALDGSFPPTGSTNAIAIAIRGDNALAALLVTGEVIVYPSTAGPPKPILNAVALDGGRNHFLALLSNGEAVSWGDPTNAVPVGLTNLIAIAAGGTGTGPSFSMGLTAEGKIVTWGDTNALQLTPPTGWPKATAISAGPTYAMAILERPGEPSVIKQPLSQQIAAGSVSRLTWELTGGLWEYRWYHNGEWIAGANTSTLVISNTQSSDAGRYWAEIGADGWTKRSAEATIKVIPGGPKLITQPQSLELREHDTGWIQARWSGSEPISAQWFLDGKPFTNDLSLLEFRDVNFARAGVYRLVLSNAFGVVESRNARMSVRPKPAGRFITWDDQGTVLTEWHEPLTDVIVPISRYLSGDPVAYGLTPRRSVVGLLPRGVVIPVETPVQGRIQRVVRVSDALVVLDENGQVYSTQDRYRPPIPLTNVVLISTTTDVTALQSDGLMVRWNGQGSLSVTSLVGVVEINAAGLARTDEGRLLPVFQSSSPDLPVAIANKPFRNLSDGMGILSDDTAVDWFSNPRARVFAVPSSVQRLIRIGDRVIGLSDGVPLQMIDPNGPALLALPPIAKTRPALAIGSSSEGYGGLFSSAYNFSTQPGDQKVSIGQTIRLSATFSDIQPEKFQWIRNSLPLPGATNSFLELAADSIQDAGTYRLEVSGSEGEDHSRTALVEILTPPIFVTQPSSVDTQIGKTNVQLRAVMAGTPPFQFQWWKGSDALPLATSDTLKFGIISATNVGDYRVVVKNSFGATTSRVARIAIPQTPQLEPLMADLLSYEGDPITLPVVVRGELPITLFWQGPRYPQGVATETSRLAWTPAILTDEGFYSVFASNRFGVSATTKTYLYVRPDSPTILTQPTSEDLIVKQPIHLQVRAAGRGSLDYQWFKNGQPIPEATTASLDRPHATPNDSGEYLVRVTNNRGSVESTTVTVTVGYGPNVIAWGSTNSALAAIPHGLTNAVALSASRTHVLALTSLGTIVGWGSNVNHCLDIPEAANHGIQSVVAGEGASLALRTNGQVIGWGGVPEVVERIPEFAEPVVQIAMGATHAVARTASGLAIAWGTPGDATRLPDSLPMVISIAADQDQTYLVTTDRTLWILGNGHPPNQISGYGLDRVVAGGGRFAGITSEGIVVARSDANSLTNVGPIRIKDLLVASDLTALTQDGEIQIAQFSPTGTATEFSPLPYSLPTVEAIAGVDKLRFGLIRIPTITRDPASLTIDEGSPLLLQSDALSDVAWHGIWLRDGKPLEGFTDPQLKVERVRTEDAGKYQFAAYNAFGTNRSMIAVVQVLPRLPRFNSPTLSNFQGAVGETVTLAAPAQGVGTLAYQWLKNGLPILGADQPSYQLQITSTSFGVYELEAWNEHGRRRSPALSVAVTPAEVVVDDLTPVSGNWIFTPPNSQTVGVGRHRHRPGSGNDPLVYRTTVSRTGDYQVLVNHTDSIPGSSLQVEIIQGGKIQRIQSTPIQGESPSMPPAYYKADQVLLRADAEVEIRWLDGEVATPWIYADAVSLRYLPHKPEWRRLPPSTVQISEGNRLELRANADGDVTYHWITGTREISQSLDGLFSIAAVQLDDSASYRVYAVGAEGGISSEEIVVTVIPKLHTTVEGQQLLFSWLGGALLQTAPTPDGPWTSLPATSPFRLPLESTGNRFFRLTTMP